MPKVHYHEQGWTFERPCVFHAIPYLLRWTNEGRCEGCGSGYATDDPWVVKFFGPLPPPCEYDVTVVLRVYPSAPAFTPRGEYAPIDPPEPPEVEITAVYMGNSTTYMGDSTTPFPWPLTPEEEEKITELVLTEEA